MGVMQAGRPEGVQVPSGKPLINESFSANVP